MQHGNTATISADRRPGIETASDLLFERIDFLTARVEILENRLGSYVRNEPQPGSPEKQRESGNVGGSVIRNRLESAGEHIQRLALRLETLSELLDL